MRSTFARSSAPNTMSNAKRFFSEIRVQNVLLFYIGETNRVFCRRKATPV
ncbi:MAG TPA: hypothetical protein PKZ86_02470 [Smithella sp.]|nr:hypothetical protein [Smithella sp.]